MRTRWIDEVKSMDTDMGGENKSRLVPLKYGINKKERIHRQSLFTLHTRIHVDSLSD